VATAGLVVAELAMDLTAGDRARLYGVFAAMALATLLVALGALRLAPRMRSLITSIRIVAFSAVAITGVAAAVSAVTMVIDRHDLTVILVALLLGVGLGAVLAAAVAGPLTADLAALSDAAEAVGRGDLAARSGVVRDDELGRAAGAFDVMANRLEAADAERSSLLTAVGHDLRTPLASLQAAGEALQDGVATDTQSYLRGMSHDLRHLSTLVDDLFLFASIEAGRLELASARLDLSELADEAVEAVTPMAAGRHVKLRVEAPGMMPVDGDASALGRVFRNLLANAVRHSPRSGEVEVRLTRDGPWVDTVVIDQGPGFAEDIRDRAFDRFARTDASRSRESGGSGLGLAIAKGIVEAHRGSILIEDGPGGRVRFSLPAA
jgi:signal transduction histidine kinase